jgi:hypothetical protein
MLVKVFVSYNWTVAPETGFCPPCTAPEIFSVVDAVVDGGSQLLSEHPERSTQRKQTSKAGTLRLDTFDTSKSEIVPCGPGLNTLAVF